MPTFVAEIQRIFTAEELCPYFATPMRVGASAHAFAEEQYATIRDAGAFIDDAVSGAPDAIVFERARQLLLSAFGERARGGHP